MQYLRYKLYRLLTKLYITFSTPDTVTYSQSNEDQILDILTGGKPNGFYIDIGASDPLVISNTRKFYERGWRGINVEPTKKMYEKLCKYRPEDINLNVAISSKTAVTFYQGENSMGSTCNPAIPVKDNWGKVSVSDVAAMSLETLFKQYAIRHVDFMTIDVEGYEWEVLKSHDWKIKPDVLCIEGQGYGDYLSQFGYSLAFYDGGNSYYQRMN